MKTFDIEKTRGSFRGPLKYLEGFVLYLVKCQTNKAFNMLNFRGALSNKKRKTKSFNLIFI